MVAVPAAGCRGWSAQTPHSQRPGQARILLLGFKSLVYPF